MTAFLFPGQGSQCPQMLSFPGLCRTTLDDAECFLASDPNLPDLQDLDSADNLTRSAYAQLALVIAGVAAARALTADLHTPAPAIVAGHSVGAFAAAVIAGALTFTEALKAVALRGPAMEHACGIAESDAGTHRQWGMAAVIGIDARAAYDIAGQAGTADNPLWVANINSRRQVVFSGTREALRTLEAAAEHAGAQRVEQIAVAVASHCPLQHPVRELLSDHLRSVPERRLLAAYLTNTRGRRAHTSRDVLADLAESVAQPVQWRTIAELLPELGATDAVEMPPGHVLTQFSDVTGIAAIAAADIGLESTARRLNRSPA